VILWRDKGIGLWMGAAGAMVGLTARVKNGLLEIVLFQVEIAERIFHCEFHLPIY
jgi:hypothetical protein